MQGVGVAAVGGGGGFDGGGEDALDADAVAAHDGGDLLAVAVEDRGSHGLGVFVAELEDVADFYSFTEAEGGAVDGAAFALEDVADVGDEGGLEVAQRGDVAEVVLLPVGSGDEVGAAFEGLVEDDQGAGLSGVRGGLEAEGAEVSGGGVEGGG